MITARNYAAQASKGILESLKSFYKEFHDIDKAIIKSLAKQINESIHFAIPDDGLILNDKLKGIRGEKIRTPYKYMTIEYKINKKNHIQNNDNKEINILKCVYLIEEIDPNSLGDTLYLFHGTELHRYNKPVIKDEIYYALYSFYQLENGLWITNPLYCEIPSSFDMYDKVSPGQWNFYLRSLLYNFVEGEIKKGYTYQDLAMNFRDDFNRDSSSFLEFIEAISCKNVSEGIHQHASSSNEKRIKQGKLPIYETKILTIDTSYSASGRKETGSGTHASPRQHLRRGHIRRLPSGNIWINSCVVGDPSKGTIHKQYRVK